MTKFFLKAQTKHAKSYYVRGGLIQSLHLYSSPLLLTISHVHTTDVICLCLDSYTMTYT